MTAQQPGAEQDPAVTRSQAFARGLLRVAVLPSVRHCDGYFDLLGASGPSHRSLAQRAMDSPIVASVYERIWRPIMVAIMRLHGVSISTERERCAETLHLGGEQRVLDVACGPGNFTGFFGDRLGEDGFVVGLDNSVAMMQRAVRDNNSARAVYMRADARSLPFHDCAFDVVCCFAALHLVPEPTAVLREMVRVLAPGGRIAVMTTYGRESFLIRKGLEYGAAICGVRVFNRTIVPESFVAAGLTDVDQKLRGVSQFVTALRPELGDEFDTAMPGCR